MQPAAGSVDAEGVQHGRPGTPVRDSSRGDGAAPRGCTGAIERADGGAWVSRLRFPTDPVAVGGARGATRGAFADDLPRYAAALRRATGRAATRAFALICHQVRTQAAAVGERALHAAAVDAVRHVRRTRNLGASRRSIEALARACERAAAGLRVSAA